MNKRIVVSNKNMPVRYPTLFTIVMWLLLDRLDAPGWVWGAVGLFVVTLWIGVIYDVLNAEQREIFKQ